MDACVLQVAAVLDELQGAWRGQRDGPVHVIGYSMGGRLALSLALARPEKVASLLLIGASPGLADPAARAARIEADLALARSIEDEGLARFVDYWMALPLFASQASLGARFLAASRSQRLRCNPLALANSLRGMGAGAMPPLHDDLECLDLPVCLVAGSRDVKFVALAESMRHRLPNARCALVEGVGHAAHLEDTDAFSQIARGFLAEVDDAMPAPPL
jgi:2-succinyl-6-hydroxy-2,4-cyclohexadiene-1-carboxylate synthase